MTRVNGVPPMLAGSGWDYALRSEFEGDSWRALQQFLERERSEREVNPPADQELRALAMTHLQATRVVILGQDPYPGAGKADGLCFSSTHPVRPPSLANVHRELHRDLGVAVPEHGSLEPWARRGVLLLNATLTVRVGERRSHVGKGWERFTDAVIRAVARENPVFLLWGGAAQDKMPAIIDAGVPAERILRSSHPSDLPRRKPCRGSPAFDRSGPFSQANALLDRGGVCWNLTDATCEGIC